MSATLTELQEDCQPGVRRPRDYEERMMHRVPDAPVVGRWAYIIGRCRGKVILSLGHGGELAGHLESVAAKCYGFGLEPRGHPLYEILDLDNVPDPMPGRSWGIELVVAGEILEHLMNPGRLLQLLHIYDCPIIISVPNAFYPPGRKQVEQGVENVNVEHVAYYSYHTLKTLVERCGYKVQEWFWYNGKPRIAEGLIFVVE